MDKKRLKGVIGITPVLSPFEKGRLRGIFFAFLNIFFSFRSTSPAWEELAIIPCRSLVSRL